MNVKILFSLLFVLMFFGCMPPSIDDNVCVNLAKALDSVIVDSNNPSGRFIISGFSGVVGGTLVSVDYLDLDRGLSSYELVFRGLGKSGSLYLVSSNNGSIPYVVGSFYSFDLANKNRYSSALSGSFIDHDFDKLTEINCFS